MPPIAVSSAVLTSIDEHGQRQHGHAQLELGEVTRMCIKARTAVAKSSISFVEEDPTHVWMACMHARCKLGTCKYCAMVHEIEPLFSKLDVVVQMFITWNDTMCTSSSMDTVNEKYVCVIRTLYHSSVGFATNLLGHRLWKEPKFFHLARFLLTWQVVYVYACMHTHVVCFEASWLRAFEKRGVDTREAFTRLAALAISPRRVWQKAFVDRVQIDRIEGVCKDVDAITSAEKALRDASRFTKPKRGRMPLKSVSIF